MNHRVSRFLALLTFLCIVVQSGSTDSFTVIYLEGRLESRTASQTSVLELGDIVSGDATLILSERGYLELESGENTIALTRDGRYSLADLAASPIHRANFREILSTKISSLVKGSRMKNLGMAGVRGNLAKNGNRLWFESCTNAETVFISSFDFAEDGMALMEDADFCDAAGVFYQGLLYGDGAAQRECSFRLGVCSQIVGELRYARDILTGLQVEPDDSFYGEYAITVAALYIESGEYIKARELLQSYLDQHSTGDKAEAARYLLDLLS